MSEQNVEKNVEGMYKTLIWFESKAYEILESLQNKEDTEARLMKLADMNPLAIELENGTLLAIPSDSRIPYYFISVPEGREESNDEEQDSVNEK